MGLPCLMVPTMPMPGCPTIPAPTAPATGTKPAALPDALWNLRALSMYLDILLGGPFLGSVSTASWGRIVPALVTDAVLFIPLRLTVGVVLPAVARWVGFPFVIVWVG